jgi:hypothetical protein
MKLGTKSVIGIVAAVILLIISFSLVGVERIDAGHVGIKVNMTGGDKGVSKTEYVTGWVFYMTPFTRVYEFPTFQQHKDYDAFEVPSKGGTIFTVKPSFNYNVNAGNVGEMFQTFRVSVKQLEEGYIRNAVFVATREAMNTYTVDSLLNNVSNFDGEVYKRLNEKLKPFFTVSQFTSGLKPDEALTKTISAKAQTIQEALRIENQQRAIKAQVENDLLEASRDSAVKVKAAHAEALSIQLQQDALRQSPQYVELIKAQKWNGALPVYMMGSGGNTFMQLPSKN